MNETVKEGAKLAGHIVGAVCGCFTVGRIVGAFMPGVGSVGKAAMYIGSSCIGGMVGNKCADYLSNTVEQFCDAVEKISSKKNTTVEN